MEYNFNLVSEKPYMAVPTTTSSYLPANQFSTTFATAKTYTTNYKLQKLSTLEKACEPYSPKAEYRITKQGQNLNYSQGAIPH